MQIAFISRYRTEIMGIAILGILLFHSTQINFGNTFPLFLFNYIRIIGYSGVDIFFFVSGFGLVFGWLQRTNEVFKFYKKRLLRILPAYWTTLFFYLIIHLTYFKDFKIKGFIGDLLGLGFLTSHSYNYWFIPSIIVCYLIFPCIIFLLNRNIIKQKFISNFWYTLLFSSTLPLFLCLGAILTNKYQLLIFLSRLPSFILGVIVAFLYYQKKYELKLNLLTINLILILGFIALFIINFYVNNELKWHYGLLWYPLIFLTFPLCLVLAFFCSYIDKNFVLLKNSLFFCGKYSLEIYLIHMLVFDFYDDLHTFISSFDLLAMFNQGNILVYEILISISLLLSFFLKKFTSFLNIPI